MCQNYRLQSKIYKHTDNGELIAQFLVNTMQGEFQDAKFHHRLDAAKQLAKFTFAQPHSQHQPLLIPTPEEKAEEKITQPDSEEPAHTRKPQPTPKPTTPTYLDILNYDIARQIRDETSDGNLIVEFLVRVMNNQQKAFVPKKQRISPADRMAASKELLKRGFGDFSASRPHLSESRDSHTDIHSYLSQRIRERTEQGGEVVRFLLDVMSGQLHEEGFTMSHRIGAAKEMLRRAYDINFDGVSWEDVETYWRSQREAGWTEEDESNLQSDLAMEALVSEDGHTPTVPPPAVPPLTASGKSDTEDEDTLTKQERLLLIREYSEALDRGDEEEAKRIEDRYYGRDEAEYLEYSPSDPDPTVEPYEPLSPEEQAKFDEELRAYFAKMDAGIAADFSPKIRGP